jgi:hypothetical protein
MVCLASIGAPEQSKDTYMISHQLLEMSGNFDIEFKAYHQTKDSHINVKSFTFHCH